MDWHFLAIVVGGALCVYCAGLACFSIFDRNRRLVTDRLSGLRATHVELIANLAADSKPNRLTNWGRLIPTNQQSRSDYQLRLFKAGIYRASAMSWFFFSRLVCLTIPVALSYVAIYEGWLPARNGAILGASLGVCGLLLPSFWLDKQIVKRLNGFRRALPDFLDLVIICLESGLSFPGALLRVSEEIRVAHPLFANELGIVLRDMELGSNVDAALMRCAERTGFDEMRGLGTIVRESQRFGSELSSAFTVQADSLRFEREQLAEEMAQKASVKILMPMLLLILPAIFIVMAGPAVLRIQEAFAK